MEFSKIKEIVEGIFSESGYKIADFTFICPSDISLSVKKLDEAIHIDFKNSLPSVKTRKLFIPISVYVEGISLSENGGSIKLKHFPDFSFTYASGLVSEQRFGCKQKSFDSKAFAQEVDSRYGDEERRRIAKTALKYAKQWADLVSQNNVECTEENRKQMAMDCENFVKESMMQSKEIEAKSAILSFVLIYLVLPAIISWVVKKFLDNYFN